MKKYCLYKFRYFSFFKIKESSFAKLLNYFTCSDSSKLSVPLSSILFIFTPWVPWVSIIEQQQYRLGILGVRLPSSSSTAFGSLGFDYQVVVPPWGPWGSIIEQKQQYRLGFLGVRLSSSSSTALGSLGFDYRVVVPPPWIPWCSIIKQQYRLGVLGVRLPSSSSTALDSLGFDYRVVVAFGSFVFDYRVVVVPPLVPWGSIIEQQYYYSEMQNLTLSTTIM